NLPLEDAIPTRSRLLQTLAPESFYHEWLDHPNPGDYWDALSPQTYLQDVDLPMLHIGGWYDTYLRGTLHLYEAMADRSAYRQQLLVGPWAHLPWGRKVGALDFGPDAASPCDRLQIRWFDQFLKNLNTGILNESPVQLFEMGSNHWRSVDRWTLATPTPVYLASSGLASMSDREGTLISSPPDSLAADPLVHDPWRPVPSLGGHASIPTGPHDRASLDCRTDVLTYTTDPLNEDLHLAGEAVAVLFCAADAPSFDVCAVLSNVYPNGSVYNLAQGYVRIESARTDVQVTLQATCACIRRGHALRLSLSAACFPAYPVNAGSGAPPGETRLIDQQIITVTVFSGGDRSSYLRLPVVVGESLDGMI
ncbi:CocE/NonD family hydrolase, partial [Leptolyngbya sp. FACHB-36]|uniref:CocE/NonD family hydrolase n=1 Tax=Leptolyngbya sp. FACHB-36 TaxID=2692808 RepID=UPI00168184E7